MLFGIDSEWNSCKPVGNVLQLSKTPSNRVLLGVLSRVRNILIGGSKKPHNDCHFKFNSKSSVYWNLEIPATIVKECMLDYADVWAVYTSFRFVHCWLHYVINSPIICFGITIVLHQNITHSITHNLFAVNSL